MALAIKSLARGQVPTTQGPVYTTPAGKAVVISGIRYTNTHGSNSATINAFFRRGSGGTLYRILDKDKSLASGATGYFADEGGLCLEADDRIEMVAVSGNTVDYVISGIERDQ